MWQFETRPRPRSDSTHCSISVFKFNFYVCQWLITFCRIRRKFIFIHQKPINVSTTKVFIIAFTVVEGAPSFSYVAHRRLILDLEEIQDPLAQYQGWTTLLVDDHSSHFHSYHRKWYVNSSMGSGIGFSTSGGLLVLWKDPDRSSYYTL